MDKIRKKYVKGTGQVKPVGGKVREARLRLFRCVERRDDEIILQRMLDMELPVRITHKICG